MPSLLVALVLALTPAPRPAQPSDHPVPPSVLPAPPPDLPALLAEAREVQRRDLETWHRFAFHRQVLRRRLDRQGEVSLRQVLDFEVEPAAGGGFAERLTAIDGREPTAAEVREHGREARFTKHYRQAREGRFGGVLGMGELDFNYLFGALDYSYLGREVIGGVPVHRLAIEPLAGDPPRGSDRLAAATGGELDLAVDGLHIVRARTRLSRPVSQGLVEIERLEIEFESQPLPGGAWIPRRIEVSSSVRGLVRIRAHNVYTYSGYERRPE